METNDLTPLEGCEVIGGGEGPGRTFRLQLERGIEVEVSITTLASPPGRHYLPPRRRRATMSESLAAITRLGALPCRSMGKLTTITPKHNTNATT